MHTNSHQKSLHNKHKVGLIIIGIIIGTFIVLLGGSIYINQSHKNIKPRASTNLNSAQNTGKSLNLLESQASSSSSSTTSSNTEKPNFASLGSCNDKPTLSKLPVNLNSIESILPMGSQRAPDQILPAEYLSFKLKKLSDNNYLKTEILSPGDIVITSIVSTTQLAGNNVDKQDYKISFSNCKGIYYYFNHVLKLSEKLKELVAKGGWDGECKKTIDTSICTKSLDEKIPIGETIAETGGEQYIDTLDYGAYDNRKGNKSDFEKFPYNELQSICPLDMFEKSIKDNLFSKIKRKSEPKCGKINYAQENSIKGNWYHSDIKDNLNETALQLSFAEYALDNKLNTIALGEKLTTAGIIYYTAQKEGYINRNPNDIRVDESIYCFESDKLSSNLKTITGSVLIKLVSSSEMQIEYQNKKCSQNTNFLSPQTYLR